jgi:hypothetical protein
MNYLFLIQLEKPIIFQNFKDTKHCSEYYFKTDDVFKKNGELKSPLLS